MSLIWPQMLLGLLLVPVLLAAYLWLLRRRKRTLLRYSSLALVRAALGPGHRLRRHLPPALLLLAVVVGILALARPSSTVVLPSEQRTLILAIDVSLSMSATDIAPNRLVAAQIAAQGFIRDLPADLQVGIVSFAGSASLIQPPTADKALVIDAIDRLLLDRHTAIGSAIVVSLATIFPEHGEDLDAMLFGDWGSPRMSAAPGGLPGTAGTYPSASIILLTDGRSTTGPHPVDAAMIAAERGVRVYSVGFGTTEGATVTTEGWSMFMRFDEASLKAIAALTGGDYYYAGTAADLRRVYDDLGSRFVLEREESELTAIFAAFAALFALCAGLLSMIWFNRGG